MRSAVWPSPYGFLEPSKRVASFGWDKMAVASAIILSVSAPTNFAKPAVTPSSVRFRTA